MRWKNGLLAAACVIAGAIGVARASDTPEVEPNDGKAGATVVNNGGLGMADGDTITGTTMGATGTGTDSSDYFIITTQPAPAGFYQHQLTLTSGVSGHTVTIRGLSQVNSVINAGTDVTVQTGAVGYPGQSADSRTVVWYGFGRSEQIYVRVTGTQSTAAPYSLRLLTSSVAPIPLAGPIVEGKVTIERAPGNGTDTDFWVYNGLFSAIPGYGNDGPNRLTRPYTPGTYYIGFSNSNFANNLPSPADDTNKSGNVLDFPDAVVNSSETTGLNLDMTANTSAGLVLGSSTKSRPFDVTLYCFTVFPNSISTPPVGQGQAQPAMTENCARGVVCMQVTVTPGDLPPSTGIIVQMNLAPFGLGIVTMSDNGLGCDAVANDQVFSLLVPVPAGQNPGLYTFPFFVRDAQDRSSQGFVRLQVNGCGLPPENDPCEGAMTIVPGEAFTGTTIRATPDFGLRNCTGGDVTSPGVWYRTVGNGQRFTAQLCNSASSFDAQLSVFCGTGGCDQLECIGGDDNSCGQLPRFSWCTEEGGVYYILVHGTGTAVGEFLLELDDSGQPCSGAAPCAPRGACCLIDGCAILTREQCAMAAGDYLGDFTECETASTRTRFVSENNFPRPIPDNSAVGAVATITAPAGSGTVQGLVATIALRHPSAGDLTATLTHGATTVTLFALEGGSADVNGVYEFADYGSRYLAQGRGTPIQPGVYRPRGSLAAFDGQQFAGVWTLRVTDGVAGGTGQIEGFAFKTAALTGNCPTGCPLCPADFNGDGGIDGADVQAFFISWEAGESCADVNLDGGIDGLDVEFFFELWEAGNCG